MSQIDKAKQYCEVVENATITDHNALKVAVQATATIKKELNETKEQNDQLLAPHKANLEEAKKVFKPALEAFSLAEKALKAKIGSYVTNCYANRDKLLQAPQPTKETIVQAQQLIPPKINGLTVIEKWDCEVKDPNAFVKWAYDFAAEELIQPNEKAIKKYIQQSGDKDPIPGLEIFKAHTVRIEVGKVDK